MKISQRLQQIDNMIVNQYDHIWDCCCDHGLLGFRLIQRSAARTIHFVDTLQHLMKNIQAQLEQLPDLAPQDWQVHCMDVAELELDKPRPGSHLIIIAGVGGELLIELVKTLLTSHPGKKLEFLLCPVRHNYKVRQALIRMGLALIDECLVEENKRFYEIIHVATSGNNPISRVGSSMWDFSRGADLAYLESTIEHYQRMLKSQHPDASAIIADYKQLLPDDRFGSKAIHRQV